MNHMKRNLLYAFLIVISLAASVSAEDVKAGEEIVQAEPEKIGLNISLKYASNYLWRGTYWYEDGVFFPGVSFTHGPFALSYTGEFSEDAVVDNKPITKSDGSTKVRDLHATDFGIDFSHAITDLFTLGAGVWYYLFHNDTDLSYLTATVTCTLSGLPLAPFVSYNHDVYTGHGIKNRAKDFYIQTGISH